MRAYRQIQVRLSGDVIVGLAFTHLSIGKNSIERRVSIAVFDELSFGRVE